MHFQIIYVLNFLSGAKFNYRFMNAERARQQRHRRKRKQKWIWSSIGVAIALGSAALVWSYLPTAKESIIISSDAPAGGAAATSSEQTE